MDQLNIKTIFPKLTNQKIAKANFNLCEYLAVVCDIFDQNQSKLNPGQSKSQKSNFKKIDNIKYRT